MTAVLVTGATTPVGRALVRALLGEPKISHVLAVVGSDDPLTVDGEGSPEKLSAVRLDLTRDRDIRDLLFGRAKALGVEIIVHTALHRSARHGGQRVHALNVESTREILRLSERHPTVRRFLFKSYADVYRVRPNQPTILLEDHPLDISSHTPQWVRDRVEADLVVCTRMGMSPLEIAVLRCAEVLAPHSGSQLSDYLGSRVCMTPLGFDPMLNLLSVDDLVRALRLAVFSEKQGIFNIPGADTLPLSAVIEAAGRVRVAVPGPLLNPLYGLRARVIHTDFRYDQNYWRFHFGGVMDGRRAREELGYEPTHRVDWTRASAGARQGAGKHE